MKPDLSLFVMRASSRRETLPADQGRVLAGRPAVADPRWRHQY
jgi:hypothetical protein